MKISLFKDIWYDCFSSMINNIIYSIDPNNIGMIYNNNYEYIAQGQEYSNKRIYRSILTHSLDEEQFTSLLFTDIRDHIFTDKDELLNEIITLLNQGHIVILRVDMYYYVPEIKHIYQIAHILHNAFVNDYNELDSTFGVYEKIEYRVHKDNLIKACLAQGGIVIDAKLNEDIVLPTITFDEIKTQGKGIAQSIEQNILSHGDFWDLQSPSDNDITDFLLVADTHMSNLLNRYHANTWLFENILGYPMQDNPFHQLEKELNLLHTEILYQSAKRNWEYVKAKQKDIRTIVKKEHDIWNTL